MRTRYKITIEETAEEETVISKSWEQGADPENGEDGWGYAPETKTLKKITREVFSRNTDDLDITAVIKAVEGLE